MRQRAVASFLLGLLLVVSLLLALSVSSLPLVVGEREAPASETTPSAAAVSFRREVMPIFRRSCTLGCHGGLGGLSLDSYRDAITSGDHAPTVVPGYPEASLLYRRLLGQGPLMPPGYPLSQQEIERIRVWIEAGAPDN